MLKLVAIGVWVILVTAGATFASVYVVRPSTSSTPHEDLGVEDITSELSSIPVMRGGEVVGYVILQLSFAADRALLSQNKLDPMPYIRDSAFRVIFTMGDMDFRHLKSADLDRLADTIGKEANRRLGMDLIRQVLFQQMNYVKREDIRTNWINGEGAPN